MLAREIMTKDPACCTPNDTAQRAASMMTDNDCGSLPVLDDDRLVGMITDRDIAIRGVGQGKGPETIVRDLMSTDLVTVGPDDDVDRVAITMAEKRIRRLPVVDGDGNSVVGLVAQADIARNDSAVKDRTTGQVVEEISRPSRQAHA